MKKTSAIISVFLAVMFVFQGLAFAGTGKKCRTNFHPGNIKHPVKK